MYRQPHRERGHVPATEPIHDAGMLIHLGQHVRRTRGLYDRRAHQTDGCAEGAPRRGGDVKSKQSHMSSERSPGAKAGAVENGARPNVRAQNLTRLTCECKVELTPCRA